MSFYSITTLALLVSLSGNVISPSNALSTLSCPSDTGPGFCSCNDSSTGGTFTDYMSVSFCTDFCSMTGIKLYQGPGTGKGTCSCGSTFHGNCDATCLADFCSENCGDSTVISSQCSDAAPTSPISVPISVPISAPAPAPVPNCPNATGSGTCKCNDGSVLQSSMMTLSMCTSICSGTSNGIWMYQGPGFGQGSCACGSTFQGACDSTCLGEFCLANCGDATISSNQCSIVPTPPSPTVQTPSPSNVAPISSTCPTATSSSGQCRCYDGSVLQSIVSIKLCTSFCGNHGGIITYQDGSSNQALCKCGSIYQGNICDDACFASFCNENCGNPAVSFRQCSTSAASYFRLKMTSSLVIGFMSMIIGITF